MIPRLECAALGVRHGFFTRAGGVSAGVYESLNGSASSADDPARLMENRARVAAALHPQIAPVGCHQVHGADVAVVRTPWPPGLGPRADAMVTARGDVALIVITADCAPILFASEQAIVGAAHAGWRGAVGGVIGATADAMRALGATGLRACVGPCIGPDGYEVGAEFADAVPGAFLRAGRPGHWWFDLPGYCGARLEAAGVRAHHARADTLTDARFWSHRRRTLAGGGAIGHQMSAICNRPHFIGPN